MISTDNIMLAIAELAKQNRELAERVFRSEHRIQELEKRIDAHGIYIEKRCLIEALEKIDE